MDCCKHSSSAALIGCHRVTLAKQTEQSILWVTEICKIIKAGEDFQRCLVT